MNGKEIKEEIAECNEEALFIDGFEGDKEAFNDALIGHGTRCSMNDLAIYDGLKVIQILIDKYDMSSEEAYEWYEYNIVGAYMGENTPIFVQDLRNE